jgi:two-component system, NtrC family, sensor histidine kinase HydH
MNKANVKIGVLAALIALTVAIHYGWVLEPIFGHHPWVHSVHGRFCYVPILIAAAWFGVRGGLLSAATISTLIVPYMTGHGGHNMGDVSDEIVEVVFYFGFGILVGLLVDREHFILRKQEYTQLELERARHLSQVGQMAASVAHEIKNPLASIKGATEIIIDPQTSPVDRKEFQDIVAKEIKRIDGTVQEFLAFARPRETKLSPLDLSASLQMTVKQIAPQMAAQGIRLSESIEPDVKVLGDQEKLHQVAINLILNAAQASSSGMTIGLLLRPIVGNRVELVVKDQGSGIDTETLRHVLEPFFTTKSSGTGLGLAIVKSIVDDHRGQILIESDPEHGTQVRILLPMIGGAV